MVIGKCQIGIQNLKFIRVHTVSVQSSILVAASAADGIVHQIFKTVDGIMKAFELCLSCPYSSVVIYTWRMNDENEKMIKMRS